MHAYVHNLNTIEVQTAEQGISQESSTVMSPISSTPSTNAGKLNYKHTALQVIN